MKRKLSDIQTRFKSSLSVLTQYSSICTHTLISRHQFHALPRATAHATMAHHLHFLVIVFPAQGQLNPNIQFAKRLVGMGARVTLVTTVCMLRRMTYKPIIDGLTFTAFSDGYDDGFTDVNDDGFTDVNDDAKVMLYCSQINRRGYEALTNLITSRSNEDHPFTAVIYTFLFPWVAEVARGFHLPSALLWTQPATVLNVYYYYLRGYKDYIESQSKDPKSPIKLPGLPLLMAKDLPSFIQPSNIYSFAIPAMEEHFRELDKEVTPTVLVNIFEALEPEALRAVDKLNMIPIGPLIPSAFSDGKDPSDTSFGGDIYCRSSGYIEWLDSKSERSVVYVSFGSYSELPERQMKEIARALLDSGRPFLWVIRDSNSKSSNRREEEGEWRKEMEEKGKIVNWCSQVEVLSHSSVGCFITHCGWNSSIESLVSGVPMVGFPQWADQVTNAKLIEDVWKTGLRLVMNEEGIAKGEEIRRCLDVVMGSGEKGEEIRKNAKKWKELATEAVKEGGSSEKNLRAFVDQFA